MRFRGSQRPRRVDELVKGSLELRHLCTASDLNPINGHITKREVKGFKPGSMLSR